jgi:hypothetical protein
MDVRKHNVSFYTNVKQLNGKGFNSKFDSENQHVNAKECYALFGGSRNFKVKSPNLKLATLEDIYWRVFGTSTITNNEVLTWIVHGFIAQSKRIEINWVKVTKSTTKENACKDKIQIPTSVS